MSEMIERVARILYEGLPVWPGPDAPVYDRLSADKKKRLSDVARSAIGALREPTQAMVDAGKGEAMKWRGPGTMPSYFAMIDEALKE